MGRAGQFALGCAVLAIVGAISDVVGERCFSNGCCYYKQGGEYTITECNLKDRENEVVISKETQSSPVQVMNFSQGTNVSVDHNALATRDRLHTVLLTDIVYLTLLENNKTQVRRTGGTSITINRVKNLQMAPGSFFGWQSNDSIISIKNTDNCHIARSAFTSTTVIKQVLLENITALTLGPEAFQGTIEEAIFMNVTITACPHGAFGGRIGRLLLFSVTVKNMSTGCISAQRGWRALTVRHSHLGHIRQSSILGSISDASVVGCDIASVDRGGFHLNVSRFSMETSLIGELGSDGVEVQAAQSISLQKCSISRLRRNAFRGLRVAEAAVHGVIINSLSVDRADPGSLRFAEGVTVSLHKLQFSTHTRCNTGEREQTRSVSVESAWQPASGGNNASTTLHTFFQSMFSCAQEVSPSHRQTSRQGAGRSEFQTDWSNAKTSSHPMAESIAQPDLFVKEANSRPDEVQSTNQTSRPSDDTSGHPKSMVQPVAPNTYTSSRGEKASIGQVFSSNDGTTSRSRTRDRGGHVPNPNGDATSHPRTKDPRDHDPNPNGDATSHPRAEDRGVHVPNLHGDVTSNPRTKDPAYHEPTPKGDTTSHPCTKDREGHIPNPDVDTTTRLRAEDVGDHVSNSNGDTTSQPRKEDRGDLALSPNDSSAEYVDPVAEAQEHATSHRGEERSSDSTTNNNDDITSHSVTKGARVRVLNGSKASRTVEEEPKYNQGTGPSDRRTSFTGTESSTDDVRSPNNTTNNPGVEETEVETIGFNEVKVNRPDVSSGHLLGPSDGTHSVVPNTFTSSPDEKGSTGQVFRPTNRPRTKDPGDHALNPTGNTTEEAKLQRPGSANETTNRISWQESETPPLVLHLAWTVVGVQLVVWAVVVPIVIYRRHLTRRRREDGDSGRRCSEGQAPSDQDNGYEDVGQTKGRLPSASVKFTVGEGVDSDDCEVVLPGDGAGLASNT